MVVFTFIMEMKRNNSFCWKLDNYSAAAVHFLLLFPSLITMIFYEDYVINHYVNCSATGS